MKRTSYIKDWTGVLFILIGVYVLGYEVKQSDFYFILLGFGIAFGGYFFCLDRKWTFSQLLITGLVLRIILLGAFPALSDDIYRFYWDGKLLWNGMSPFSYLPSELDVSTIDGIDQDLFMELNSSHYYSIYPPIAQLIYGVSAISNMDIAQVIIKVIIMLADVMALKWLWGLSKKKLIHGLAPTLYFLNPLLIVEGTGNLHFEGIMIMFVLGSIIYTYVRPNYLLGGVFLGLAIATKLLPLMLIPFLFRHEKWMVLTWAGMIGAILFVPIVLSLDLGHMMESVGLYFRKFEFNASVYFLLRAIGYVVSGYNLIAYIGPMLAFITTAIILWKALRSSDGLDSYIHYSFFAFAVYLALATTIHPWYIISPLLLGVMIDRKWIVLWSALVVLSYAHYSHPSMMWIVIEYGLLVAAYVYMYRIKKIGLEPNAMSTSQE